MFVDTRKIIGILVKEPPVMQKREELKLEKIISGLTERQQNVYEIIQELKIYSLTQLN